MSAIAFRDLSPEIVDNVVQHVDDNNDLKNLRLVSKDLEVMATRKLFRTVFLSTDRTVIGRYEKLVQSSRLATLAHHVLLWTQRDIGSEYNGDSEWYWDNPEEEYDDDNGDDDDSEIRPDHEERYENAVQALQRLQNLKSILLAFTPGCLGADGREDSWSEVTESFTARVEKLQLLFEALQARAAATDTTPVRSLTIVNLQNEPVPAITSSAAFQSAMSQLEHLHLQIVQEYNEHGPDHDYSKIELRTFPPHLITHWLSPISSNLKSLCLYAANDNWGPFPGNYDALTTLAFPQLKSLALGYYTIAHDDQLNWILAIPSLTSLTLHRCMIARHIRTFSLVEWAVDTRDWHPAEDVPAEHRDDAWHPPEEYGEFIYHGVWSALFARIADELPSLQNFSFSYPEGDDYGVVARAELFPAASGEHDDDSQYHYRHQDEDDEDEDDEDTDGNRKKRHKPRVFPQRYVNFDQGILPTHWPEADREGEVWWRYELPNHHKEELERDQEALEALLGVCRERRAKAAGA